MVDENDEVLSSAKVTAVYTGGALDVYSDNTGMYEIHNLKQGTYRVLVSKAGYNETSQNVSLIRNKASTQNFKLKKSSSPFIRQAIASQKQKQAALPSPGRTITKPGRTVSLPSRIVSTSSAPAESKTGQKSKLDIIKTLDKIKTPITSGPLKTPLGTTRIQTSLGNGSVRGTVKDSKSGGPVSGASVSLRGKSSTQTDGSGQFSFSDLAPGVYAVTIRKSGYMDGGGSVTIKPGQTTTANFRLTPLVSPKQLPSVIRRLKLPETGCGQ